MLRATLLDSELSPAFKAQALLLPAESFIGEQRAVVDPEAIRQARRYAMRELGRRLSADWQATYVSMQVTGEYSPDATSAGKRALRNLALVYLAEGEIEGVLDLAREQLVASTNMTDAHGALSVIVNSASPLKAEALIQLARVWSEQPLLMNKWFQLQATAIAHPGEPPVVERVRLLMRHPGFSLSNPNNVNALIRSFCALNEAEFHRRDAGGYAFWVDQVLALDKINPTIAARIARTLDRWRKFTADRQAAMRAALEEVARQRALSRDVCEIVNKSLAHQGAA
jgi:aminopeptidase N